MLLTYLKLSFRLLRRNLFFALLNILGLATGFAAFLILWPYAQAELNTDKFHQDYDQIARLGINLKWTDDNKHWDEWDAANPGTGSGVLVKNMFSEVTDMTRLVPQFTFSKRVQGSDYEVLISLLRKENRKAYFPEKRAAFADPNFFQFFSFPLVRGSADQILARPRTVALSESVARKYFADANPIDKIILLNDSIPYRVSGVFRDLPRNTHLQADLLFSTAGIPAVDIVSFDWMGYNYIKVKGGDFKTLDQKMKEKSQDLFGTGDGLHKISFILHPLPELAFISIRGFPYAVKSKQPLVMLNVIAFVILGLAWVNYVSLSIHQLRKRLPEIGTRKAVGASTRDFVLQFLVEAALMNAISFLLALTLVQLVGRGVTGLFGFYLVGWEALSPASVAVVLLVLMGGVLASGLYPVWVAAGYKPLQLLKKLKTHKSPRWVSGVVTLQYTSAIVLLIWIMAVYAQIKYIMNKDLGINRQAVLVVDCPVRKTPAFNTQLQTFLHKARTVEGVRGATFSESVPGVGSGSLGVRKNSAGIGMGLDISGGVDEHFIPLYGIKLLAGRNFGKDQPVDQTAVLLSKDAVKRLGFASIDQAVGNRILLADFGNRPVEVVGVYQDYECRPFLMGLREDGRGSVLTYKQHLSPHTRPKKISVKVDMAQVDKTIAALKNHYTSTFADPLFEWRFLEDNIARQYAAEKLARNQITLFTGIAIFIACLGLLGMISNKAEEKTKEIGIRKVFGAQKHQIARILLWATLVQVGVATLIAIPVAHYLIGLYLAKFSDRVSLQWWHYGIPLLMLLVIMGCTVAAVLRKAAKRNPVEALRYE
jgi:putative ABC transport system permease protein